MAHPLHNVKAFLQRMLVNVLSSDFFVIFHTAVDILVGISFLHYKQWYHGTLVERHTQTFISNSYEMWS